MRFGKSLLGVVIAGLISALSAMPAQAATIIDLSAGGSDDANGALYVWTNVPATGTGAVEAFLRVSTNGSSIHTRDIQVEDLVVKNITGIDYYQFLLDVNESLGQDRELINLDNIQIFTTSDLVTSPQGSDLRFNSDSGGDVTVLLDASLNGGSGSGDMFLYVPVSVLAGTLPSDYVYFYSLFSNADAGFEEWGLLQNSNGPTNSSVPEPGSMILLGTGLLFAAKKMRRGYRH